MVKLTAARESEGVTISSGPSGDKRHAEAGAGAGADTCQVSPGGGGDMSSQQGSHDHREVQLVSKEVTSKTFLSENSKRNWSANVNSRFGCSYNHNSIINYYFGD